MHVLFRFLMFVAISIIVFSFVWFLWGSTANFQRGMDIIGTTYLWGGGIPILLLAIIFTFLIIKGWVPTSRGDYVAISVWIAVSLLLSGALIQSVSTHGWAEEKVESDSIKITQDEKYEYRIDLINLFQKNSHARLYLKDLNSQEVIYIPVDIQTRKVVVLGVSEVNHWGKLEATDNASQYILYTTEELGIPMQKFLINTIAKSSTKVN